MYGTHTLEIINRLLEKDDMGCQRGNQFEEVLSSEKEVFTRILLKFFFQPMAKTTQDTSTQSTSWSP